MAGGSKGYLNGVRTYRFLSFPREKTMFSLRENNVFSKRKQCKASLEAIVLYIRKMLRKMAENIVK